MNGADTERPLIVQQAAIRQGYMNGRAIMTVYYYPDEVGIG